MLFNQNIFIKHIFYVTELDTLEVTKIINKPSFEGQDPTVNQMECWHLSSSSHPTSFTDEMRLKQTSVMALASAGRGKHVLREWKWKTETALPTGPGDRVSGWPKVTIAISRFLLGWIKINLALLPLTSTHHHHLPSLVTLSSCHCPRNWSSACYQSDTSTPSAVSKTDVFPDFTEYTNLQRYAYGDEQIQGQV